MLQTTVVGSYPVPTWLKAHPSPEAIRDAVRVVLQIQERAGIDLLCDGELTRWNAREFRPSGMVERFVSQMDGIVLDANHAQRTAFQHCAEAGYRATPAAVVVGELGAGRLDLERESRIAAELTRLPLKFTITSPYMIAKLVQDEWYHDFEQLTSRVASILSEQIARIGAAVVQVDEPNLPGSPHDALIAAEAINTVLASVPGKSAVHLCFGNFGGQRVQQGDYGHLLEFFDNLDCEHLVLETTRRPLEELRLLRDVKLEIEFGFGVIDVKDLQVETPSAVANRIEALAAIVGENRIKYVHPDCGLSHLPRDVADSKLAALCAGRDLFVGTHSPAKSHLKPISS
jgi:5-methyltetrahydropteroyltriglutamate--homocysteine methyltransferase